MRSRLIVWIAALFISTLGFGACGSNARQGFESSAHDASVPTDAGAVVATQAEAATFEAHDGAPSGCATVCSGDLHSVLDCNGRVLVACPPDQGCAAGKCIAPCDAAAANKSSIGCDYYVYPPPPFFVGSTACLGAFIANTWTTPVKLSISRAGQSINAAQFAYLPTGSGTSITYAPLTGSIIPPGAVALALLNKEDGVCPAEAATGPVAVIETGRGQAFRLQTDAPVVVYDIFPYGGGATAVSSATLLTPTTAWSDNYVGTTAYPETVPGLLHAYPWLGFVAAEDGTEVTIRPSQEIVGGGGIGASAKGTPVTYTLAAGEYVQLAQDTDLTGSIIKANKPIGTWAGNRCSYVPTAQGGCDGMHQQIPPIRALGSTYVGVRYRNRLDGVEESPPWRILGAVSGTELTFDPPQPNAPTTIQEGQLAMFEATGPFIVKAQDDKHPFYFAGYMTGCNAIGTETPLGCTGDPEFVNVVPPDQFLSSYVFFTDPTYPETNLVFTRKRANDGTFKDVDLDCVGTLTGWSPIGANGDYEYTRVDLVKGVFEKQGACDNGRHEAKSAARFGLTVWGWGNDPAGSRAVSYAYPAGASVMPINDVVVPPVVK